MNAVERAQYERDSWKRRALLDQQEIERLNRELEFERNRIEWASRVSAEQETP